MKTKMYEKRVSSNFTIFIGAYLVILSSLLFASFFGDTAGIPPPNIGVYALLVGALHFIPVFIALRSAVRLNPYISLMEWSFHGLISFQQFLIEVALQALGATLASLTAWLILKSAPGFIAGVGNPISNTDIGWAFLLQMIAGIFLSWTHFTYRDFTSMALIISGTCAFLYPFIGATTTNPYRWLGACIIEGTCGSNGSWIFPTAPLAGITLGYLMAQI